MSITTLLGFLSAFGVFVASIYFSFHNASAIIDPKSALMVVGGTAAVTLICFPIKQIRTLLKVFFKRVIGKNKIDYNHVVDEIVKLSEAKKSGRQQFNNAIDQVEHPFLRDAAKVLFWMKVDVTEAELRKLLETRAFTHYKEYMAEAKIFKTIAKFPPAFGLMGTTIGLIALLQSLGMGDDAKKLIGPAMAIALVTTLYGLAISNFLLIPIAENLTKQTEEDQKIRYMIVEGVMLIQANKPTKFVEESVKSFLLPSQRNDDNEDMAA